MVHTSVTPETTDSLQGSIWGQQPQLCVEEVHGSPLDTLQQPPVQVQESGNLSYQHNPAKEVMKIIDLGQLNQLRHNCVHNDIKELQIIKKSFNHSMLVCYQL